MSDTKDLKKMETILHTLAGFGAGVVNLRLLLDRREWKQLPPANRRYPVRYLALATGEAFDAPDALPDVSLDEYWPQARVMDTLRDSREYSIGGTVAWFVVAGLFFWAGHASAAPATVTITDPHGYESYEVRILRQDWSDPIPVDSEAPSPAALDLTFENDPPVPGWVQIRGTQGQGRAEDWSEPTPVTEPAAGAGLVAGILGLMVAYNLRRKSCES